MNHELPTGAILTGTARHSATLIIPATTLPNDDRMHGQDVFGIPM